MPNIQRRMWLIPGYDCILIQPCKFGVAACKPGKGSSHGRHSAELWMAVLGHEAEVLFSVNTSWSPIVGRVHPSQPTPSGIEVCWHTAWPQEGQTEEDRREPRGGDASCKDWKDCYQTSTGLSYVEELTAMLVKEGSDAVFKWLENEYWKLVK